MGTGKFKSGWGRRQYFLMLLDVLNSPLCCRVNLKRPVIPLLAPSFWNSESKIHVFISKSHVRFHMYICSKSYCIHFCSYVLMPIPMILFECNVSLPVPVLLSVCLPLYSVAFYLEKSGSSSRNKHCAFSN